MPVNYTTRPPNMKTALKVLTSRIPSLLSPFASRKVKSLPDFQRGDGLILRHLPNRDGGIQPAHPGRHNAASLSLMLLFILPLVLCLLFVRADGQINSQRHGFPRIDSQSVWHPPGDFKKRMDKECAHLSAPAFQVCVYSLMRELGASPQALYFTSLTDTTGYIRDFRNTGNVDIAYVFYPYRANENFGVMLVNGNPRIVDVDDFSMVKLTLLKKDSTYLKIVREFPDAAVWPGDRYHLTRPESETLPDGTQRFIVNYWLLNGCHACKRIGTVTFAFDFDKHGLFMGTKLIGVNSLAK